MAETRVPKITKKHLVLLDAHAILHRAYHALPNFTSSTGEPTGGLYGLSAMLLKIVNDLKPDYVIACYDLPGPTYRHEVYEAYKAGRKKAEEDLIEQMGRSKDIFRAFNIPIYEKEGFEADDILGTIAERVKRDEDIKTTIASGDMDTLQLVDDEKVVVYTLRKGIQDTITYNEKAVEERFGFKPELLPDYKGLRGDPSDNIIGVKGIGEKTATVLIENFGTIEDLYKALKKDPLKFEKLGIKERVMKLLEENEEEALFSKELATIRRDAPIDFALPKEKWRDALEPDKVLSLFHELGFRALSARVSNMFNVEKEEKESVEEVTEGSREFKEATIGLWLLNSDITNPKADDIFAHTKTKTLAEAREIILKELEKADLMRVYKDIELPLILVIEKMHSYGIKINRNYLDALSKEYHRELAKLEKKIWKHAGEEFNINSPRQLGEVLFEKLGLSVKNHKKTGTGQKSTRESELEKMRDDHPIISNILAHRELQKLLSTYIDNIPELLDEKGRLHTTFLQTGTTTGRMSSQNPNLQNIPIRTELGRNIRRAFVAEDGFVLAAFDYSQIELRVAAFLSGDEKMIGIFKSGGDIHRAVAAEVFNVPEEMVDGEMRRRAKVINFGIHYGMGVNALRQALGTTRAEAQRFYTDYFKNFSGLARYLERIKGDVRRKGYTETYFGRRRYFEGINSSIPYVKAAAERMAINAPIQGTQADIIKIAMGRIDMYIIENKLDDDLHLLLQVHDELVCEIQKEKLKEVAGKVKEIMEGVLTKKETQGIPIIADVSAGDNWGQMKKMKN